MLPTRPLGPAGRAVSSVGYGGMHLSIQERPPEAQGIAVIDAALGAGMTLIDTANVYCLDEHDVGHNERLIARALAARADRGRDVVIATKGGVARPAGRWEPEGRPDRLREACDASLTALGVERIALYQLHTADPRVPFEESVGALAELRREGKIDLVGLSNVSVEQIQAAERMVPVASVQNRLSPFFREALTGGVVRYCSARGIAFLAYSPTGGGRLTRKLPSHPVAARLGEKHGVSAHAAVLAWVLAQSPTVIVIPSARRVDHALDSARAATLSLDADDLKAIDDAEFSRV